MNTNRASNIFNYLNNQDIPPILSISFCLRLMDVKMNEIYKSAWVSRNFLYQVLAEKRKPNEAIKKALNELGLNPWNNEESIGIGTPLTRDGVRDVH